MVEPGTVFLLCSDGITRHIPDAEIEMLFNNEIEPEAICGEMRELCYSRGAEDNLTAVVVRISSELVPGVAPVFTDDAEVEEETVATVRSPFDSPINEIPIQEIQVESEPAPSPAHPDLSANDDESYLLSEPEVQQEPEAQQQPEADVEDEVSTREYTSDEIAVPTVQKPVADDRTPFSSSEYVENTSKRGFGSVIMPFFVACDRRCTRCGGPLLLAAS